MDGKRNQPYLFVSFSEKDGELAEEILARMQRDAFCLRYKNRKMDGNRKAKDALAAQIESCGMFLAFVSEAYLVSTDCTDELNYARDLRKPCVLVYLDDARLPGGMRMRLSRLQGLFYRGYEKPDDFFRQLYQAEGILACRMQEGAEPLSGGFGKTFSKKVRLAVWVSVFAAAVVCLGILGIHLYRQTQDREENSLVTLAFYPNEDMKVKEYAEETERLEGAFEALCGEDAEMTADESSVRVTFPKSVFGGEDTWEDNMNSVLRAYVIAPIWLRLCRQSDASDSLWVRAEEMESVEVKTGTIPGASESDLAAFGIDREEYDYIEISLSDSGAERVLACLAEWKEDAEVVIPFLQTWGYGAIAALTEISGDGKIVRLAFEDYDLSENITELIAYKIAHSDYPDEYDEYVEDSDELTHMIVDSYLPGTYTTDPGKFWEPFTYLYDIPVDSWETASTDSGTGLNQCKEEALAEDAVTVRLYASSLEMGEGERQDELDALKSRLDTLDQPYAIGSVEGCGDLVVKTAAAHLGTEILELLTYDSSFQLGSYLYGIGNVEAENLSVEELSGGTYGIVISYEADSTEANALAEASEELAVEGGGKIWLSLAASNGVGTRLASANVTAAITDGRLVLDELSLLGTDSITEDTVWAANLIAAVLKEDVSSWSFHSESERTLQAGSVREDTYQEAEPGILPDTSEQAEIQSLLQEESGIAADTDDWPDAAITITLSDGQQPEDALEKLKEIYERCGFDIGKCGEVTFNLKDSGGNAYAVLWFTADDSNRHCMVARGQLYGGSFPEYAQRLQTILSTDEFFVNRAAYADTTATWEITED